MDSRDPGSRCAFSWKPASRRRRRARACPRQPGLVSFSWSPPYSRRLSASSVVLHEQLLWQKQVPE